MATARLERRPRVTDAVALHAITQTNPVRRPDGSTATVPHAVRLPDGTTATAVDYCAFSQLYVVTLHDPQQTQVVVRAEDLTLA